MKEQLLRKLGRFTTKYPWWIVGGIFVLIILSLVLAQNMDMELRWSDMLPANDPKAKEFERIIEEYKSASTILIVVQGDEAEIKQYADEIAPQIEKLDQYVERVDYKIDKEFFSEHGFMLAQRDDLETTVDMFGDLNLVPFLNNINDNFEKEYVGNQEALSTKTKEDEAARSLDGFLEWLQTMDTFIGNTEYANKALVDSTVDQFLYGDPYFISYDKGTILISCKPTFTSMDINKDVASTIAIEKIIEKMKADYPGINAGITGVIPLQKYEMEYMNRTMLISSIVALLLVITLFILSFRMVSAPLLAGLNLIIAIIITVGITAIVIGRLNMMTMVFAIILIGLGIDYSIHLISVYHERRNIDPDRTTAMEETFARSGSGIMTGALTTAAAFFALVISSTRGIKEMGIVLGIGILSAMATSLVALPAVLTIRERIISKIKKQPVKPRTLEFKFLGSMGKHITHRPFVYLGIAIVVTAFFLYQALNIKFNYDMLDIEPDIPCVHLQDTIVKVFDMSPDFAMITGSSIEESWELEQKAKSMPALSIVEGIGDVCPPESVQNLRQPFVEAIRENLALNRVEKPMNRTDLNLLVEQLQRLDMNIYELSQLAYIGGQDKIDDKCKHLIGDPEKEDSESYILQIVDRIKANPDIALSQLNRFQHYYFANLHSRVYRMANPKIITLDMLPESIRERYVSESGTNFLVTVYARQYIWDFEVMKRFTKQLELVSPRATGTPPIFLHLINLIGRDGLRATILTLIIVTILLWIDFRSFKLALLGIIPLITGGIWMMGIMKSLGMLLDVVNVIGIPMIVGIGIDDGVHILHRYKYEGFNKTPLVLRSTGKAILLTSLTTMAGFGTLAFGGYPAYRSLGILLAIGVAACFVTTVLFIPAIISLVNKRKKRTGDS
jgi:hopanoid biosynthesis associated RND transporter like protein HpnN